MNPIAMQRRSTLFLAALLLFVSVHGDSWSREWDEMDYGPYLTASIESSMPRRNIAQKGIAVRLGKAKDAYIVFDSDLMRYAAGWSGKFLDWKSVVFDGSHRSWPSLGGEQVFGTTLGPGWARNGSFADPRTRYPSDDYKRQPEHWRNRAYGPLPHAWAKYKGLYLHGETVIFSYSVGEVDVLESPGLDIAEGKRVFVRTLNIEKSSRDLHLRVATLADAAPTLEGKLATGSGLAVAVVGSGNAVLEVYAPEKEIRVKIPATVRPVRLAILISRCSVDELSLHAAKRSAQPANLKTLTMGGPARWPEILTTSGKVGEASANATGPFAMDEIVGPKKNPWKSWLRFGGFDFFPGGQRAAICTWNGDVWIVDGIDDTLASLKWQRIATGMFQPLGLKIVDQKIYVSCRDQITRLHDLNGDKEIDFYESFNNDHQVTEHFHEFVMDLQTDKEGNFYYAKSARHALNCVVPHHGTLIKVSKDGKTSEILCNGFRAANGVGIGPGGEMLSSDQEGHWTPANRINWIEPGQFYGNLYSFHGGKRRPEDGYSAPLLWLPKGVDRSPASQLWVDSDSWGLPRGTLVHTSYGTGKMFLVLPEKVDGQIQGGAVEFPGLKFATGIMRARFNERDGQLYICGLSGWSSNCPAPGGFYRVRYTKEPVRMPTALHIEIDGLTIGFSCRLDRKAAASTGRYRISQWNYRWTRNYGSAHFSVKDPKRKGQDRVKVESVTVSKDGRSVKLKIPDIQTVMQMEIRLNIDTEDGHRIRSTIYNTINKLPAQ